MFGIGPMEIVVVIIVALVFVGPSKLPELAKQMGRFFVQAKRMTSDVRTSIDGYMKEAEAEIVAEERQKIKELIEAEIASSDPMDTEGHVHDDPHHDDHGVEAHERDEYFETGEDDPAYAPDHSHGTSSDLAKNSEAVEASEHGAWDGHKPSDEEKKS